MSNTGNVHTYAYVIPVKVDKRVTDKVKMWLKKGE